MSVPLCREPFICEDEAKQRKELGPMCRERFIPEDESDEESSSDEDSPERKSGFCFLDNYPGYNLDNLEDSITHVNSTSGGVKYSLIPKGHPLIECFGAKHRKNFVVGLKPDYLKALTKDTLKLIKFIRSEAKRPDFYDRLHSLSKKAHQHKKLADRGDIPEIKSGGTGLLERYPGYTVDNLEEDIVHVDTPSKGGTFYSLIPKGHPLIEVFIQKNGRNGNLKPIKDMDEPIKAVTEDTLKLIELFRSEAKKKSSSDFYDDKLLPWTMNKPHTTESTEHIPSRHAPEKKHCTREVMIRGRRFIMEGDIFGEKHEGLKNDVNENKSGMLEGGGKYFPSGHPLSEFYDRTKKGKLDTKASINLIKNAPPVTRLDTSETFLPEQLKEDKISQTNECAVCMNNLKNTLLLPCAHACVCTECSDSIDQCPLCRTDHQMTMEALIKLGVREHRICLDGETPAVTFELDDDTGVKIFGFTGMASTMESTDSNGGKKVTAILGNCKCRIYESGEIEYEDKEPVNIKDLVPENPIMIKWCELKKKLDDHFSEKKKRKLEKSDADEPPAKIPKYEIFKASKDWVHYILNYVKYRGATELKTGTTGEAVGIIFPKWVNNMRKRPDKEYTDSLFEDCKNILCSFLLAALDGNQDEVRGLCLEDEKWFRAHNLLE